jgi:hypothetical protein
MTAVISKTVLASTSTDTAVFDLPSDMASKFDALSEARYNRMEWEKKEKALKKEILAVLPERQKGVKFVLRVAGVIRASVRQDSKTTVKAAELLAAFPEAYEALANTAHYDVVSPA